MTCILPKSMTGIILAGPSTSKCSNGRAKYDPIRTFSLDNTTRKDCDAMLRSPFNLHNLCGNLDQPLVMATLLTKFLEPVPWELTFDPKILERFVVRMNSWVWVLLALLPNLLIAILGERD